MSMRRLRLSLLLLMLNWLLCSSANDLSAGAREKRGEWQAIGPVELSSSLFLAIQRGSSQTHLKVRLFTRDDGLAALLRLCSRTCLRGLIAAEPGAEHE